MRATIICDASYCQSGVGGWAAWVRADHFSHAVKGYGSIRAPMQNSTVAELYAALNGVWLAQARGATDMLVRSDCTAVREIAHGRCQKEYLNIIWNDALATPWGRSVTSVRVTHVKGHGPIKDKASFVNNWCDEKAKQAMRAARLGKHTTEIEG